MEDDHVNSDLLEDEELASLRLAALATLKHKKTNTTAVQISKNAIPDNSLAIKSVNRSESEPSQIPFLQSDRNAHGNLHSWRKQPQVSRRRGNAFLKTRSNLIVISPVSLDDSKGSDEKPAPALVLPQHKWCNSGNEDSMSPKTLRRTGPTRFNRHGSDSESSDSDYENSDNDSGSNETVLQDEPQEHFSRASPENQKDIPENVEKQRRLSFQNLESDIKSDAFDKNETTSIYNCLKNSAPSYGYKDNRSDNYASTQNQSDDKHSWTYSGGHSYSAETPDPSSISGKRRNSSHVNNGESCIGEVAGYTPHMSESASWQHPSLEMDNSYYTQESVSENNRNPGMNDRKSIGNEIEGSENSPWQHGQERLRTNNQYFTRDTPYNNVDSRSFIDNDISPYSDSKNLSSQKDLRHELKKNIQEYKGHDNQKELIENRRHTDSWDNSRQRFPHRGDRNFKDGSSYHFRTRQEDGSSRQSNRRTRSYSRERVQCDYSSSFHRRRHERSVSQDRNRQDRSSSRDRIRYKHTSVYARNKYENSLSRYDRSSSLERVKRERSSSEERSKRECSLSQDRSEQNFTKERQKRERSISADRNKHEHTSNKERSKRDSNSNRDRNKKEYSSSHERSSHERSISQEKNRHDHSSSRERSTPEGSFSRGRSRYRRSSSRDKSHYERNSSWNRGRRGRSSSRIRSHRKHSSSLERKREDRSSSRERRCDERSSSQDKNQHNNILNRRQRSRSTSKDRNKHEQSLGVSKSRHEQTPCHSKGKQDNNSCQAGDDYCSNQNKNKKEPSPSLDQSNKIHSLNSEKSKDLHSSPEKTKQETGSFLQRNQHLTGQNPERLKEENRVIMPNLVGNIERKRQWRSKSKEKFKDQSQSPLSRQIRKPGVNDKECYSRSRSRSSSSFSSSSSDSSSSHSSRPKIRSVPSVIKSVQPKLSDSGIKPLDLKLTGKRSRSSSVSDCSVTLGKKRSLTSTDDHNKLSVKCSRIDGELKNASDGNKRVPVHMRLGAFPRKRVIQMTKDVEAAFVNSSSSSDGESVSTKSKRPNIRIVTDVYDSKNVLDNEKKHHSGKNKFETKSPDSYREKSRRVKTYR